MAGVVGNVDTTRAVTSLTHVKRDLYVAPLVGIIIIMRKEMIAEYNWIRCTREDGSYIEAQRILSPLLSHTLL